MCKKIDTFFLDRHTADEIFAQALNIKKERKHQKQKDHDNESLLQLFTKS